MDPSSGQGHNAGTEEGRAPRLGELEEPGPGEGGLRDSQRSRTPPTRLVARTPSPASLQLPASTNSPPQDVAATIESMQSRLQQRLRAGRPGPQAEAAAAGRARHICDILSAAQACVAEVRETWERLQATVEAVDALGGIRGGAGAVGELSSAMARVRTARVEEYERSGRGVSAAVDHLRRCVLAGAADSEEGAAELMAAAESLQEQVVAQQVSARGLQVEIGALRERIQQLAAGRDRAVEEEVIEIHDTSDSPEPTEVLDSSDEEEEEGEGADARPTKQARTVAEALDPEEAANCSICYEAWSSEGAHRVAALRCGHLFGQSCIAKWLKQSSKCPQCNQRARAADIRAIYAPCVLAVDNSALLEAQATAEAERARRRRAEAEVERMKRIMAAEIMTMRRQMQTASCQRDPGGEEEAPPPRARSPANPHSRAAAAAAMRIANRPMSRPGVKSFRIHTQQARSLDLSLPARVALLSETRNGRHGLRKVSLLHPWDYLGVALQPGTGVIKDLRLSGDATQALVAAIGAHPLQVVNVHNGTVVASLPAPAPAWSCAWARDSEHTVFAGLQNGEIAVFDLRRTQQPLAELRLPNSRHPIHTVIPTQGHRCALLSASVGGVHAWEAPPGGDQARLELLQASRLAGGVGSGGQPCVSLAASPAATGPSTVVATFRAVGDSPPYHHVFRAADGPPIGSAEPPSSPPLEGWPAAMASAQPPSGGLPSPSPAGPAPSGAPAAIAGYTHVGRLGGHGYTTSAHMCRTSVIPPISPDRHAAAPHFACADAQTRQIWLWNLQNGAIVKRLPPHESHILSVQSSLDIGPDRRHIGLASLSESSLRLAVLDQINGGLLLSP